MPMTPQDQYAAFIRHVKLIHPGFNPSTSSLRHLCGFLEGKLKANDIRSLKDANVMADLRRNSPKDHQKYLPALAELFRVWGTQMPYTISPIGPVHRRQSFNRGLHVGAENELSGTTIVLLDEMSNMPVPIGYGQRIARTRGQSNVMDQRSGRFLPLNEFQVEGASGSDPNVHTGSKGMIEVVGGPMQVNDNPIASECLGLFIDVCADMRRNRPIDKEVTIGKVKYSLFRLDRVLNAYNQRLQARGGSYTAFQLDECKGHGGAWYLSIAEAIQPKTQLNFEVPFLKLGTPGLGKHDFAEVFEETNTNSYARGRGELFKECRRKASETVAALFADAAESERQHLRSYFTLFSFVVSIKCHTTVWQARVQRAPGGSNNKVSDHEAKNHFEVLPKINLHELLHKHVLRECPKLKAKLGGSGTRAPLKTRLCGDGTASFAYGFTYDAADLGVDVPQLFDDYFEKAYGAYSEKTVITGTGKPLPASSYMASENDGSGKSEVLTIVFEMRSVDNSFNALGNLKRATPKGVKVLDVMNDLQSVPPA
jgi:hypothetical protein